MRRLPGRRPGGSPQRVGHVHEACAVTVVAASGHPRRRARQPGRSGQSRRSASPAANVRPIIRPLDGKAAARSTRYMPNCRQGQTKRGRWRNAAATSGWTTACRTWHASIELVQRRHQVPPGSGGCRSAADDQTVKPAPAVRPARNQPPAVIAERDDQAAVGIAASCPVLRARVQFPRRRRPAPVVRGGSVRARWRSDPRGGPCSHHELSPVRHGRTSMEQVPRPGVVVPGADRRLWQYAADGAERRVAAVVRCLHVLLSAAEDVQESRRRTAAGRRYRSADAALAYGTAANWANSRPRWPTRTRSCADDDDLRTTSMTWSIRALRTVTKQCTMIVTAPIGLERRAGQRHPGDRPGRGRSHAHHDDNDPRRRDRNHPEARTSVALAALAAVASAPIALRRGKPWAPLSLVAQRSRFL